MFIHACTTGRGLFWNDGRRQHEGHSIYDCEHGRVILPLEHGALLLAISLVLVERARGSRPLVVFLIVSVDLSRNYVFSEVITTRLRIIKGH